jgi:anti-anti-sigma factor
MAIKLESQHAAQGLIVRLIGDAGVAVAEEMEAKLMELTADKPRLVVLDLAQLSFISSLGMGSLVNFHKAIHRQGGTVRLAGAQPLVADAFRRSRLHNLLDIRPTVEAAMSSSP